MILKRLQKELPYKLKPKLPAVESQKKSARRDPELVQRCTAVILEPEESRIHELMQVLHKVKDDKRAKDDEQKRQHLEKRKKVC